jgi:hypothetical protein
MDYTVGEGLSLDRAICYQQSGRLVLMQSTGLADRNGKEIFEGDVVELFNEKRKIRWADGSWYFVDREGDGDHVFFFHRHMEVIGNIYENPELMKDGM